VFADAGRGYRRCVPRPEAERWPEAALWRTLARAAAALRPQAQTAQLVCPAVVPAAGRIAGRHGGLRRQTLVGQVRSGAEMQRLEVLSAAHFEPPRAAMTEEQWEVARLPAVVAEALDEPLAALSEAYFEPLRAAMTEEHREAARLPAVAAEAAQDEPREAAVVRDQPLAVVVEVAQDVLREAAEVRDVPRAVVAEAAQDVLREAAEVRDVPLAVVAEAAQDVPREAAEVRVEPRAVVTEVAQDVPREAAEVRVEPRAVAEARDEPLAAEAAQDVPREAAEAQDEPLVGALPLAEQRQAVLPSAAPEALSLLAARLAQQRTRPPPRGPELVRFEWSKSQSLRAGSIEFVSWRPVREKESNNVGERFVPNVQYNH
jgi:hypothetical protein